MHLMLLSTDLLSCLMCRCALASGNLAFAAAAHSTHTAATESSHTGPLPPLVLAMLTPPKLLAQPPVSRCCSGSVHWGRREVGAGGHWSACYDFYSLWALFSFGFLDENAPPVTQVGPGANAWIESEPKRTFTHAQLSIYACGIHTNLVMPKNIMNVRCIHIRVISFLVFIVDERSYCSCDKEKRHCMCFSREGAKLRSFGCCC
jgi:hypothetical protein